MRKIIIAISFVFICLFSNAQEKNQLDKMINTVCFHTLIGSRIL